VAAGVLVVDEHIAGAVGEGIAPLGFAQVDGAEDREGVIVGTDMAALFEA
jgi:hypothetical protein